ncbi:MAG TPA: hypothetical protein VKR58_05235, partial [Aquella sp.]|nr:hypothetical protein [Aquella sp.]
SQKTFATYQSNNFPARVTSYVEFYIDTEVVALNGIKNISRGEYIYSYYISYQGLHWTVTYPSLYSAPDSTAAVEATITYNGKNNITSSISYCPKNCY